MMMIETDYGIVKLGPHTLGYLDDLDANWCEIRTNKRRRGRKARYVRQRIDAVENMVCTLAAIAWHAGIDLREV